MEIRDYVLGEVKRRGQSKDPVRDVGAYLARCLREGFGKRTQEEREQQKRAKADAKLKHSRAKAKEKLESEVEALKKDFWNYQVELVNTKLAQMSQEEQEEFQKRFLKENSLYRKRFNESGLKTPIVRAAFYNFAVQGLLAAEERNIRVFAKDRGATGKVLKAIEV